MCVFVLLVQSADNLFYVNQKLAQNVGTGILIIKRPSGRNLCQWRDRSFLSPPSPCFLQPSQSPDPPLLRSASVHHEPRQVIPLIRYGNLGLVHAQGLPLDIMYHY